MVWPVRFELRSRSMPMPLLGLTGLRSPSCGLDLGIDPSLAQAIAGDIPSDARVWLMLPGFGQLPRLLTRRSRPLDALPWAC